MPVVTSNAGRRRLQEEETDPVLIADAADPLDDEAEAPPPAAGNGCGTPLHLYLHAWVLCKRHAAKNDAIFVLMCSCDEVILCERYC